MASIPFGARYRLVDFPLSNMVNSGIYDVSIITHYNYQSLMDHVGAGKDWDLARRKGGLRILPPYVTAFSNLSNTLYDNRLHALQSISGAISHMLGDYIVMSDCDSICNIDLSDMLDYHIATGSKITYAVKTVNLTAERSKNTNIFFSDGEQNITDIVSHPKNREGKADIGINITIATRSYLEAVLLDAAAHGYSSLSRDIVLKNLGKEVFKVYHYDGFYAEISSLVDYFDCNMSLLESCNRDALFSQKNRPILTKVRNSAPTKYCDGCVVQNSMLADGCLIEGRVENSIIFRGVKVSKGAVVKNSILFQDTLVGENVSLNCVIADKNVVVRDGVTLSGHQTMPFYIEKGKMI
jgi:glucose-1-phosphate adenylyltransferase